MNFLEELRRRNVLRVGAAYLVVGWFVLQSIDVVFPILGFDEALGRPILALLVIGLPVALLMAWFLELTPEGLKHEKDVDRSVAAPNPAGRRLDRIIIVVLVAAIGLLLVERFVLQPTVEPQATAVVTDHSLAVLPFVNLSGNEADEYFSDGLTETLLHMLAQIPELKVAARTSVFAFKGRDLDVRDIGVSLGVAHILEGSVQRYGNKLRITAQLVEAATGFHLWSQNFDRDMDDIFTVQDEIAASVADALQVTLLGNGGADGTRLAGVGTGDAEAYELFLQGLEQKNVGSYGSLPQAENLLKRALSLDPTFAEAKLELAKVYQMEAETGLIRPAQAESRITPLLEQVLEERPDDGRALGMVAAMGLMRASNTTGPASPEALLARQALESAIAGAPNEADLYAALAGSHLAIRDADGALRWIEKGLEIDPLSARLHLQKAQILLNHLDQPEEALEVFARGRELAPGWTATIFASGDAEMRLGNFGKGVGWYLEAMQVDPQDHELPSIIARIYYSLRLTEQGDEMYDRARAMAPQEPWPKSLELERQLRESNYERAVLLAESFIRDNIENRGDAYNLALFSYVSAMIELGQAERVPEFFESVRPGISSPAYRAQDIKDMLMQFALVYALVQVGSVDVANTVLATMTDVADAAAPGWRDNPRVQMMLAIAHGEMDAAAEHALADLARPLSKQLDWELTYRHYAWVRPVLADERVARRLGELDAEVEAAREDVLQMLGNREAGRQAARRSTGAPLQQAGRQPAGGSRRAS